MARKLSIRCIGGPIPTAKGPAYQVVVRDRHGGILRSIAASYHVCSHKAAELNRLAGGDVAHVEYIGEAKPDAV